MGFTFDTPAVDEFEEMVSYRKDVTGIDCTVFISPRGIARHSPRITIGLGLDPRGNIATVTFDGCDQSTTGASGAAVRRVEPRGAAGLLVLPHRYQTVAATAAINLATGDDHPVRQAGLYR